jgi:hypothetical protein
MPTYLYCILPAAAEPPAPRQSGVGGSEVRVLEAGPLAAWVETVDERTIAPTLDRVRVHDAVVTTALQGGATPLPARFGQVFESDASCRAALIGQASRMETDLARVQGLVEMRIIVRLPRAEQRQHVAAESTAPGTSYMRQLQRDRSMEQIVQVSAAAVRRRLTETVGAFVRDEAMTLDPLPAATLTLSHLVARDEIPAYRTALNGADLGDLVERIVVSGPVAPYQFVSAPHD